MYPGQEGEADIERKMVLLEFKCQYEDEYLLHLVPIKPVETTIDAESARGNFRIQMKLFKDRTFVENSRYPENPIVAIDEEVCVQMALVNSLGIEDLVLTVKDCWTGASKNSSEKHMQKYLNRKRKLTKAWTTKANEHILNQELHNCSDMTDL